MSQVIDGCIHMRMYPAQCLEGRTLFMQLGFLQPKSARAQLFLRQKLHQNPYDNTAVFERIVVL